MRRSSIVRMGPWIGITQYGWKRGRSGRRWVGLAYNATTGERIKTSRTVSSMTYVDGMLKMRPTVIERTSATHHEQLVYLIEQLQYLNGYGVGVHG